MLTLLLLGAFVAHFWEKPSINTPSEFSKDVISILQYVTKIESC